MKKIVVLLALIPALAFAEKVFEPIFEMENYIIEISPETISKEGPIDDLRFQFVLNTISKKDPEMTQLDYVELSCSERSLTVLISASYRNGQQIGEMRKKRQTRDRFEEGSLGSFLMKKMCGGTSRFSI